mmetsp:Transcript_102561/g.260530  ORF Transcript_102561/g.260530 Transcript_102561/m.260530 type:complete len:275 (-) Transcript_102561:339-1163(-)
MLQQVHARPPPWGPIRAGGCSARLCRRDRISSEGHLHSRSLHGRPSGEAPHWKARPQHAASVKSDHARRSNAAVAADCCHCSQQSLPQEVPRDPSPASACRPASTMHAPKAGSQFPPNSPAPPSMSPCQAQDHGRPSWHPGGRVRGRGPLQRRRAGWHCRRDAGRQDGRPRPPSERSPVHPKHAGQRTHPVEVKAAEAATRPRQVQSPPIQQLHPSDPTSPQPSLRRRRRRRWRWRYRQHRRRWLASPCCTSSGSRRSPGPSKVPPDQSSRCRC